MAACAPAAPAAPTAAPKAAAPTTAPAAASQAGPNLTAPASSKSAATGAGDRVLRVVLGAEPAVLDPSIETTKPSQVIDKTMLETLAINTRDQKYAPWLAESWESIEPTKWRLKLKKGVKFHNGEPFDAEAVAFSFDLFVNTKGMPAGYFTFVAGTEKVDDHTIDIVTKTPTSVLPATLALLYVFPPKYYASVGPQGFARSPIGTGPFKFVEWNKGVNLKVTEFPEYWGKKQAMSGVEFRWAPEASTRVAMLETGEIDIAQNIPPAMIDRVDRSGAARVEAVKSIRNVYLMMNMTSGPLSDVRVRRALNHAVDVESIIKTLYQGRAYGRDRGVIMEGFEGYQGDKHEPFKFDPELAKKLIAEAGYPDGFETTLWHPIGRYVLDKEASEAIAAYLGKVGVKVTLQGMEPTAYFAKLREERLPGLLFYSCGPLFMSTLLCGLANFSTADRAAYGANEKTDTFLKDATAEMDPEKRAQIYRDFDNYVYKEHVPWVWLWYQQDLWGVSNRTDWKPQSDELIFWDDVSFKN